jgi:hypothetical protein
MSMNQEYIDLYNEFAWSRCDITASRLRHLGHMASWRVSNGKQLAQNVNNHIGSRPTKACLLPRWLWGNNTENWPE